MIEILTDLNFNEVTTKSEKPVLVDFWASWCAPCRMQAPIIDELDKDLSDKVVFAKLNVDDCLKTAQQLGIMSIPTLLLYKNGKAVEQKVGLSSKEELAEMLSNYID